MEAHKGVHHHDSSKNLHKAKDAYYHVKFSMNAISNRPGEGTEEPLFYSSRLASPEETLALLEAQRSSTGPSTVAQVSFSCSGRCTSCLHVACEEHRES